MDNIDKEKTLIILDRDGVINEDSPDYIKSADEWHALPGSLEAIARLNRAGKIVTVATNQSGLGRGLFEKEALEEMHNKMQSELAEVAGHIDEIVYCSHTPDDHCPCRKPKSGMIEHLLTLYKTKPEHALLVGDSLRDIQAANALNVDAVLVTTGKGTKTVEQYGNVAPVFENLAGVVDAICDE